jgi:hypothetical protein
MAKQKAEQNHRHQERQKMPFHRIHPIAYLTADRTSAYLKKKIAEES